MRLIRLALRDFRAVERAEVELLPAGVTVIAGPNEVGKTTLAESLDFLFDRRDDSRAQEVLEAQPAGRDVGPEVEAEIEAGRYRFRYRKRFVKDRETVLELLAPERRQHTGREAHEKVLEILAETVDLDLWRALRVEQGASQLQPARLGSRRSLLDALGGSLAGAREQALHDAAAAELERYFTAARLQPKGELAEARQGLAAAAADLAALEGQMEDREADAAACDRLERRLVELRGEVEQAAAAAERAESERAEVERREATVRQRRAELAEEGQVAEHLRELAAAADEEAEVAGRLAAARAELSAAEGPRQVAAESARAAEAAAAAAGERATQARQRAQDARRAAERRAAVEALRQRLARAEGAAARLASADAGLAGLRVDEAALDDLERRQRAIDRLAARLEAASPRLTLTARRDLRLEVAGAGEAAGSGGGGPAAEGSGAIDLAAGERWERRVAGRLAIGLPGVAELVVEPGNDVAADAAERQALAADLSRRLADLGAADLAAARVLARDRAEAERARLAARALAAEALAGGSLEALAAELAAGEADLAELLGTAPSAGHVSTAAPSADVVDPAAAEEAAAAAERAAAETRRAAEEARRALAGREQAHARAVAACQALDARAEAAADRHRRARAAAGRFVELHASPPEAAAAAEAAGGIEAGAGSQLALFTAAPAASPDLATTGDGAVAAGTGLAPAAPAAAPPPGLAAALAEAEERVRAADVALDEARRRLAEAAPAAVGARVEAARQARRRGEGELRQAELEHRERVTRLEAAGEAGLFERLQEARARHAHADSRSASVEARAAAAERLHRVLSEAREEARRTYSEPLRRAIEELGRPLFGADLGVELDGELAIARRTLGGVTLRFDQLSTGAREQLALVARLACAMLVDREGAGVPLIVDDALGLTDRDRLRAMGEVLTSAAERCQVIVLTSFPERYRHVRGARVVSLAGQGRSVDGEPGDRGVEGDDGRDDERIDRRGGAAGTV